MILAPRYWLAPCLIALSAWINDNKELADKALKEALKRNEEKTTLFFALVSRRVFEPVSVPVRSGSTGT